MLGIGCNLFGKKDLLFRKKGQCHEGGGGGGCMDSHMQTLGVLVVSHH